jgi:hypothetical protein
VLAAPAPPREFAEPGELAEGAPQGDAPQPLLPVPGGSEENAAGGVPLQADGGVVDTPDLMAVPPSSVTAAPSATERGTNGALIFD